MAIFNGYVKLPEGIPCLVLVKSTSFQLSTIAMKPSHHSAQMLSRESPHTLGPRGGKEQGLALPRARQAMESQPGGRPWLKG